MLKLTPPKITGAILAFFLFFIGLQHFVFSLSSGRENSDQYVVAAILRKIPLLSWLERLDYDTHLRWHVGGIHSNEIIVIDIHERSLKELGQFPFARSLYAKFLERLQSYGLKVVAFDITFPERERNESLQHLNLLKDELSGMSQARDAVQLVEKRVQIADGDRIFADSIRNSKMPIVMGFAFDGNRGEAEGKVDDQQFEIMKRFSIFRKQVSDNSFVHNMSNQKPITPHLQLLDAIPEHSSLGFFVAEPDEDSVIRRAPAVFNYGGMALASLAVRAVSSYLGVEPALVGEDGLSIQDREQTGKLHVPLTPQGSVYVRYYGLGKKVFKYVEFSDVVSDDPKVQKETAEKVKGKIAFVGTTAVGLKDLRASPLEKDYPGVEVHATIASNILTNKYMLQDQRYFLFGYIFTLFFSLFTAFMVYKVNPILAAPATLGLALVLQFVVQNYFFNLGVVVPSFLPTLAAFTVLFAGVLFRYFTEEKEKKKVRGAFSRYVSSAVVEEILKDHSKLKLGGQKKTLTVMFCDLKGFTKLSEHMDATKLTALLNEYFTRMTNIILKNKGTLDKYMGDAIMCFWGAPLDIPNHAELACKTAIEMVAELKEINRVWKEKHGITLEIRIGLHTGEMSVGNMGSEQVFSYTVMGDHVNLGSRLEGVNNIYGTSVVASEATKNAVNSSFHFRALDEVLVKGKEDSVKIFELLTSGEVKSKWMNTFTEALELYRSGNWMEAKKRFQNCLEEKPGDMPSLAMIDRINGLDGSPPENWNGIWKIESK
jgi:adenylate cyclase